jgi:hypothetical protein
MTMMKKLVLGLFGLLLSTAAYAAPRMGILPMPSVRKQIYQEAKSEGVLNGLKRPSLRLQKESHGRVGATIYSMGRSWPMNVEKRMAQKTAEFKVVQVSEGKLAQPVKQEGRVWQQIYYALGARN